MYIISNSAVVNQIYQSLESTKDLFVSSILYGEKHTGKKSLIEKLYPASAWVSAKNLNDVKNTLENYNQIIITDFEEIINIDAIKFNNSNVIALYNKKVLDPGLENKFAFIYHMPPLSQREEDIELLSYHFSNEAKKVFAINKDIELQSEDLDLSENFKSLKSSIYKSILLKSLSKDELSYALQCFFKKNYEGNNVYKESLEIFEKALLETGLELYKSQLKLSDVLGINRNTLRKKINEYS